MQREGMAKQLRTAITMYNALGNLLALEGLTDFVADYDTSTDKAREVANILHSSATIFLAVSKELRRLADFHDAARPAEEIAALAFAKHPEAFQPIQAYPGTSVQTGNPTLEQLDILYREFGDVPVNYDIDPTQEDQNRECIDTPFYIWQKGTDQDHIKHWFDDKYAHYGTCLENRWWSEEGKTARRQEAQERERNER